MKKIIYALMGAYLLMMSFYLYTHQYYNFDIEAYMGLVYKANHPDMKIEEIHAKVYQELNEKKPGKFTSKSTAIEVAKDGEIYYKTLSENAKAYEEELQLFSVKPFYNFINSVFFKMGFSASVSTFLITIISYVLIVLFIFIFLLENIKNHYLAFILTLLISFFKPLLDASRHATPDVFSCLLLLLSFYFFLYRRNIFVATIFGMLCIFTRPEYFIFYSMLFILIYLFDIQHYKTNPKFLILSYIYLFLSFALIQYFNQISWSVLFMNQFTKVQIYPISNPDSFVWVDYFNYLKSKAPLEFNTSYFTILLIFIVIILAPKFHLKSKFFLLPVFFFFIIYASVFIRFLIFPSLVNRMMLGFYLLIILSLILIQISKKNFYRNSK